MVVRAARAFHLLAAAATNGGVPRPTVFRVLEVTEDGNAPTLADALSRMQLDPDQTIEVGYFFSWANMRCQQRGVSKFAR